MKIIIPILLAFFVLSCSEQIKYDTYTSEEHKYQIDYPSNWDTENFDARMNFSAVDTIADSLDMYPDGFNISVYPNPEGVKLEQIVEENLRIAKELFPDAVVSKKAITNKNGVNGQSVKMVFVSGILKLTNNVTFISGNGNLYTLTQSSETSKVEEYSAIFDYVLDSFMWLE